MVGNSAAKLEMEVSDIAVLVVDDDISMAEGLVEMLRMYGLAATHVANWPATLAVLKTNRFDIIILDQRLGRIDTIMHLGELRRLTDAPVVFLSGNQLEADRILGLEMGAADFLLKPISGREIVARIRAHLRRALSPAHSSTPKPTWRISVDERRLYQPNGSPVPLTSAEFSLLEVLSSCPGQPTDRDILTQRVLNRPYRVEDRSIDNLVYQLRLKIGQAGGGEVIVAMRSRGYAFTGFENPA
ncbi:MAG: response regulator transcription factor [Acetobacteraceae bacterium]|nr:MAG: response regulator transcription factor [Acetobacteraceae bacterium]